MPHDFAAWLPSDEVLTTDELIEILTVAVDSGISEVRLTGGEPLLRPDIVDIVSRISSMPRAPKLSLTTNGIRLPELAQPLRDAGLSRVNVSLDTLSPERFAKLTYRDRFDDVMRGLRAARDAGLSPVKVNTVLMRGVNDDEAADLLSWAMAEGYRLRFIEQMPLDAGGTWERGEMVAQKEILDALGERFTLTEVGNRGSEPAEEFYVDGGPYTVGIIASVSAPFCAACDRLRLTADGQLRSCLFALGETDLRSVLRDDSLSASEKRAEVVARFESTVARKKAGHGIDDPLFIQPLRPMSAIGG
jgi:cyclic pyranopterin phosphate synthase